MNETDIKKKRELEKYLDKINDDYVKYTNMNSKISILLNNIKIREEINL